jgi:proteasome assembly chaperone 3
MFDAKIQASIPSTTPLSSPDKLDGPIENSDSLASRLPAPPAGIQLTPLLGGGSSEHLQTLHSLYAAQIATIIWVEEAKRSLAVDRRSVVVGIALRRARATEGGGLDADERNTFHGVMHHLYHMLDEATSP